MSNAQRYSRNSRQKPSRQSAARAFSLIEAVLAIGIVSFAMVGILGLVPIGLGTFRTAMNLTLETSIVQEVASELQRSDYTNVISQTESAYYYFDDQGAPVSGPAAGGQLYTVEVLPPGPLEATNLVNGEAAATAVLKVSNKTQPETVHKYSVIVPRSH